MRSGPALADVRPFSELWSWSGARAVAHQQAHRGDAYGDDNRQDGFNDIVVYEHRELDGHHGGEMHRPNRRPHDQAAVGERKARLPRLVVVDIVRSGSNGKRRK
jgi:hypothetical protein